MSLTTSTQGFIQEQLTRLISLAEREGLTDIVIKLLAVKMDIGKEREK